MIFSFGFFVIFIPGLLACSLPPFTRYYSVTERTVLAPIVVHARVINTTRSESQAQSKYDACIEVERVIKGRQFNIPRLFCLGKYGPDFLCLVHVRAGSTYIFFIDDDFTARYDGVPSAVAEVRNRRIIEQAQRGYCDPYVVGVDSKTCELPTIEASTFKRAVYVLEGRSTKLPCVHTGTLPLISKWSKNGAYIRAPPDGLRLREVSRKDGGLYVCSIYNPAGITTAKSFVQILQTPCGGFVSVHPSKETSLRSPNFPNPFPKDKMCAWRVCPPVGKRLEIRFDKFDLRSSDRLEITNECDRQFSPWQTNCGSVSPGTFITQCDSMCIRLGLSSSYRTNRIATGFNASIRTTEKRSTQYDVAKLWCDHDHVVKARPEELSFDETKAKVVETYKDGPPFAGDLLNITLDLTIVNIFGCPTYLKYNRHYYMVIDQGKENLRLTYAMQTTAPEVPQGFVQKLTQFKKSKPSCKT